MQNIFYILILGLYYVVALVLRSLYYESFLKYYLLLFIPLIIFTFAFFGQQRKTLTDALVTGLIYGLIFGAIAGVSELIIFHFMMDVFPQKISIITGNLVESGLNWNVVLIPLYRTGIYALAGTVLSVLGYLIGCYRK